ncbi:MAG: AAA family ATPase [Thermoplasmata archaeon]|nr:AAA family ATPase [Thermoplasmata archaeon]
MGTSHRRPECPERVALTGTPGTGKTAVGRRLSGRFPVVEVADLAVQSGLGTATPGGVEVDLAALSRALRRRRDLAEGAVVVGHLAHLLPIPDVVVLRCRPDTLARRLKRARRGTAADRRENYLAESLDIVLAEALGLGRRVWEVDTSGRTVVAVAREVADLVNHRPAPRVGVVDWLADPRVAAHLLDPPA